MRPVKRQRPDAAASYGDDGGYPPSASGSTTVGMTPEVKQAIADEVSAQLAAQQAQANQDSGSGGQASAPASSAPSSTPAADEVPPALDPARRTFVVRQQSHRGGEWPGVRTDRRRRPHPPDRYSRTADNTVNASVSASKKSDCAAGQTVAVKVDDLQEMQTTSRSNSTTA